MSDLLPPAPLTVSQLNAIVRELLEQQLLGLWVAGEVSNLTRAASGHYYFSLKDSGAQVRCVLFKFAAQHLATPLKEGDHIEISGKISLYEARGEFQISVSEVRQMGLGQLYERYEQLKQRLSAEGLFAPERKRPLPSHPRTVGIVTSLAAAALRDVVSTFKRRAPDITLIVYPTAVQGAGSDRQIAQAVRRAAQHGQADVLIVCRGGGSIEDLWSFNEEAVVRAIAESPIPTVSGVGHETDFTLADFAADLRAPTPTAAAEIVSPDRSELIRKLARSHTQLRNSLLQRYQNASQHTDRLARLLRHPRQKLLEQHAQISQYRSRLRTLVRQQLQHSRERLSRQYRLLRRSRPDTAPACRQLDRLQATLVQTRHSRLEHSREQLLRQQQLLEAVSPQNVLARGFAVVRTVRGRVVQDADTLKQGQKLHLVFARGETDVQVLTAQKQQDLFE